MLFTLMLLVLLLSTNGPRNQLKRQTSRRERDSAKKGIKNLASREPDRLHNFFYYALISSSSNSPVLKAQGHTKIKKTRTNNIGPKSIRTKGMRS